MFERGYAHQPFERLYGSTIWDTLTSRSPVVNYLTHPFFTSTPTTTTYRRLLGARYICVRFCPSLVWYFGVMLVSFFKSLSV